MCLLIGLCFLCIAYFYAYLDKYKFFPHISKISVFLRVRYLLVRYAHVFVQAMELLWDGKIRYERVLVFVTDAARYMSKAASSLRVIFDRMIHVTCLAHAIHRVVEQIRVLFPRVDQLVANIKVVLLKAPSRTALFNEKVSSALPPKPILTRWGTWWEAVRYYAANFDALKKFVCHELAGEDSATK